MFEIVISDTSGLIFLSKIDRLEILQELYLKVNITNIIAEEFGDRLPVIGY